ncbi:cysteine hydrolase family protein [Sporolactobacillus spathodeae]|uniref:Nicotinamidase-related amidase n=1 Tax=Sporolactobacillus spathodeae TaxID=1465502 RepID=A0ABS2Q9R5_9BACL|nr:isochorismatase family cysteine hydrolase [Sporolactobacillus spathodeae]MBM7658522.1 nicotinamidase-related amidase [Sporolactobacillus spathodeae]
MELNGASRNNCALLIIDMMNTLDFGEGPLLLRQMQPIIEPIRSLSAQMRASGLPIVYVNDNAGKWRSDKDDIIHCALRGPAASCVQALLPQPSDYFIVKPKHSGFFATPLQALLTSLEVRTLILCGVAGNICVLFTANDAYMRDYRLIVPRDCCASNVPEDNHYALRMMENVLQADTREQSELDGNNL